MRFGKVRHIHFVGIGGVGMSGIAELLLNMGYQISGSDLLRSDLTDHLVQRGVTVYYGHRPEHVEAADVVVYSSAVPEDNPELTRARERNIPVIKRAEMLAELMRLKFSIGVAGTHGKTTTTSMLGTILQHAGLDPTIIVGGKVSGMGSNSRMGHGELLVAEADEFDRSFLKLIPTMAVITNVEPEHLECYRDYQDLQNAFVAFGNKVPFYGKIFVCLDDEGVRHILPRFEKAVTTFGLTAQADVSAAHVTFQEGGSRFTVIVNEKPVGEITLQVPGKHNVVNALAAVAVALELDVPFATIQRALQAFTGVYRRFEIRGMFDSIMLVDDYAHHPTEIRATLQAAKSGWPNRRIVAVFQPHLYTRTQQFYQQFAAAFLDADVLIVLDVYPAREQPIPGVNGQLISDAARTLGHKQAYFLADRETLPQFLMPKLRKNDMVITIGAGDVWKVNRLLEDAFRTQYQGTKVQK